MRRFFLKSAQPGDLIEDVYVVTGKQIATTGTGKFYIKCFVGDKTMQATARMWNATREIFNQMPDNGFAYIRGRVENYQNNNQVIIEAWGPAMEGKFEVADLLPHTAKDIRTMWLRIVELCDSLQNRHVAALVQAFLDDADLMRNFRRAPAAMSFHHAYIGGLLEHTLNAMEVADALVRFYPTLNRDLVLAGIFLHDLGKTWELKYDTCFSYSDGGQLIGHIVKIAMWIEEKARVASQQLGEEIPRPLLDVLQHIVLSHHGELQFGAPKTPATPEAMAVHLIENMDAKLTMSLTATRDPESPGEGNWTDYLKAFSVRMFKPDLAPADAPVVENAVGETDAPACATPTIVDEPVAVPATPAEKPAPQLSNPLFGEFVSPKKK